MVTVRTDAKTMVTTLRPDRPAARRAEMVDEGGHVGGGHKSGSLLTVAHFHAVPGRRPPLLARAASRVHGRIGLGLCVQVAVLRCCTALVPCRGCPEFR